MEQLPQARRRLGQVRDGASLQQAYAVDACGDLLRGDLALVLGALEASVSDQGALVREGGK